MPRARLGEWISKWFVEVVRIRRVLFRGGITSETIQTCFESVVLKIGGD